MSNCVIDKSVDVKQKSEFCYGGGGAGDPPWAPRLYIYVTGLCHFFFVLQDMIDRTNSYFQSLAF